MANQRAGLHNPFGPQPITDFQRDPFGIGKHITRTKRIGASQAIALNFFATIAVRRVSGKGCCTDVVIAKFGLYAVEGAGISREHWFIDARFIVTEQRIKLRAFQFQIELANAGRVIAPLALVRVDGVVSGRINDAAKPGVFLGLVAVIRHGHQPLALDPPLGIECNPRVSISPVAVCTQAFKATFECVETNRASGKANHCPGALARCQPKLNLLLARHFTVAERHADR